MPTTQIKNPIARLLEMLPKQVAQEKRRAIEAELTTLGRVEHFKQRVVKPGWEMDKTQASTVSVLMQQLGLTFDFFVATDEQRQEQIQALVENYYKEALTQAPEFFERQLPTV